MCAIGTVKLRQSGAEVELTSLGPLLPVSTPEITAGFGPEGYYNGTGGPGAPPFEGPVYGSFPDSNMDPSVSARSISTATPRWRSRSSPVPTVADVDRRARCRHQRGVGANVPAARAQHWWAWHPALPLDREITVEVIIEDKGVTWGQWIAVGWPHVLKPNP